MVYHGLMNSSAPETGDPDRLRRPRRRMDQRGAHADLGAPRRRASPRQRSSRGLPVGHARLRRLDRDGLLSRPARTRRQPDGAGRGRPHHRPQCRRAVLPADDAPRDGPDPAGADDGRAAGDVGRAGRLFERLAGGGLFPRPGSFRHGAASRRLLRRRRRAADGRRPSRREPRSRRRHRDDPALLRRGRALGTISGWPSCGWRIPISPCITIRWDRPSTSTRWKSPTAWWRRSSRR